MPAKRLIQLLLFQCNLSPAAGRRRNAGLHNSQCVNSIDETRQSSLNKSFDIIGYPDYQFCWQLSTSLSSMRAVVPTSAGRRVKNGFGTPAAMRRAKTVSHGRRGEPLFEPLQFLFETEDVLWNLRFGSRQAEPVGPRSGRASSAGIRAAAGNPLGRGFGRCVDCS